MTAIEFVIYVLAIGGLGMSGAALWKLHVAHSQLRERIYEQTAALARDAQDLRIQVKEMGRISLPPPPAPAKPEPKHERLDTASDETFDKWMADTSGKTIEEFAETAGPVIEPPTPRLPAIDAGSDMDACGATSDGFVCEKPWGHKGDHSATLLSTTLPPVDWAQQNRPTSQRSSKVYANVVQVPDPTSEFYSDAQSRAAWQAQNQPPPLPRRVNPPYTDEDRIADAKAELLAQLGAAAFADDEALTRTARNLVGKIQSQCPHPSATGTGERGQVWICDRCGGRIPAGYTWPPAVPY